MCWVSGKDMDELRQRLGELEARYSALVKILAEFAKNMDSLARQANLQTHMPQDWTEPSNIQAGVNDPVLSIVDALEERHKPDSELERLRAEKGRLAADNDSLLAAKRDLDERIKNLLNDKTNLEEDKKILSDGKERLQADLKQQQADYRQLWEKKELLQSAYDELAAQNRKLNEDLQDKTAALGRLELAKKAADAKAVEMDREIAALRELQLPEQEDLAWLWQKLRALPEAEKELLALYFDVSSLSAFMAGCGQFNRLEQLWEACARKIGQGASLDGMPEILERLLRLYNSANRDSRARLVMLEAGSPYDYMQADRVGSNGQHVAAMLLPGLARPNGGLVRKCLVSLK